jgi:hypothetical protein
MKNEVQLITYADRLSGGTFRDLQRLLDGPFAGAFGGVHVLPFFHPIDGADAGFDPIDHTQVDPRLGTWEDVAALAARTAVMADVIVNHMSRRSPQFLDYDARGEASPYAGLFLTYDRVFPDGAREPELAALQDSQRPNREAVAPRITCSSWFAVSASCTSGLCVSPSQDGTTPLYFCCLLPIESAPTFSRVSP